jgi:predicted HAD superfamily phosphohydrolase YqeG
MQKNSSFQEISDLPLYFFCFLMWAVKGLRVVFDLDNTLVTYPTIPGDYTSVNPIHNTISLVKQLKERGAYIIIHTARRMATHNHK